MKKIFLIGAAALGMFFMTTSCMDNTEPAGIEAMRQAKAELITAQAAYQNALAATEQANAAIKQAEAEYATLVNQIKEIEVQEAQLDLELAQAENEYKIAQLEYEYQKQMAIDSAEIMRLKSLIAGYEWEILRNEMEMEKLEYQRKEALEMHNAYMYDLQKLTAEAQQRYERALAEIEAASYGLTDAQKNKLNDMVLKMQYYRKWLNDAEDKLIAAQNNLLDVQYALGRDTVYYKELYQIEKEAQAQKVTDLQELLAEAQAMDFSDLDALTAEKEALEAANQQIDKDIAELRNQAAEKAAAELAPLEAQQTEIDAQEAEIEHSIRDLYLQVGYEWDDQSKQYVSTGVSGALNERHDFEVEIPEAIVPHVATKFNNAFGTNEGSHDPTTPPNPSEPNTDDIVILSGFEQVDGEWTLPGGVYSWRTTYAKTKEILNDGNPSANPRKALLDEVADLAINPASLSNVELVLGEHQETLTELTAEYEYFLGVFNEGLADFNTAAAAYGITYHSSNDFVADKENLMAAATEAYNAYKDATQPTEAQTKAFVDAVYAEQSARADLVGNSYDWEDLTYANLTAASSTITIDEVIAAYDNSVKNPVIVILNGKNYEYTGTPLTMDTKLDDYNAAAKWDLASKKLYGLHYLRAAVTEELIGYGEIFEIEAKVDVADLLNITTEITPQDAEAALKKRLEAIGYDGTNAVVSFKNTDFYKYLAQGVIVETLSSMVSNNALYVALNEDLKAINEEIKTIEKEQNDGQTEIFLQIRDLYAQLEDLQEQESEIDVQIAAKKLEISAIAAYEKTGTGTLADYEDEAYSQAQILKDQKKANEDAIGVIDEAISALKYEIDGKEVSPDAQENNPPKFTFDGVDYDTIEELYDAWVKNIKEDVALAQYELAECEEKLERMLNSKGNPMEQAVADAERKLEQAQQDYDIALQQFNYWSEALNQMMAALIGNTEENPEA